LSGDPVEARRRLSGDRHRPTYHFLPPANWMNDPNGLVQWRGVYHLFYQHNPAAATWGPMHWGHTSSPDLAHWTDLPIALAPTPGATDDTGCWSGCAIDDRGTPTLVYTGRSGERETVCLATGDDDLLAWRKHPANPVVAGPPPGLATTGFRDPCVWREGDRWRMALGSGVKGQGGAVLLYESPDLLQWKDLGPLFRAAGSEHGEMWECPAFFPLGDHHLLMVSAVPLQRVIYFIGRYAGNRFTSERQGVVDWGGHYYAPQVMADAQGRRLMFGWCWEGRSEAAQLAAGWAGVQALPRVLSLSARGELLQTPAPEIEALRGAETALNPFALAPGEARTLPIGGERLELCLVVAPGSGPWTLKVRRARDGAEETAIRYDPATGTLSVDRSRASLSADAAKDLRTAPLTLQADEPLELRLFLDASLVEVFANQRACLTTRIYPQLSESTQIQLAAGDAPVEVLQLTAWAMHNAWNTGQLETG
jgi:beta-fructofuranosidase